MYERDLSRNSGGGLIWAIVILTVAVMVVIAILAVFSESGTAATTVASILAFAVPIVASLIALIVKIDVVHDMTNSRLQKAETALERALVEIAGLTDKTMQQTKVVVASPPTVGLGPAYTVPPPGAL